MAFQVTEAEIRFSFTDRGGIQSHTMVWIPYTGAFTWAAVASYAATAAARLRGVSNARLDRYRVTVRAFDSAASPAAAGSDVQRGAAFVYATASASERLIHYVPALNPARLRGAPLPLAGLAVDETLPAVQDLVDLLVTGDGTVQPATQFNVPLTALNTAYLQYRA